MDKMFGWATSLAWATTREASLYVILDPAYLRWSIPEAQWGYLKKGVMIDFPLYGLIHYEDEVEEDVHLISRG
ncbi:hypothetical protein [Cupriavidus sp. D384]|uniref:hypothetical protein n=1 Tax=Cupriavidus sp. D384 TaxID=1538095 RepID=UPI00082D62C8|nr:hypothetical protein [Cupriavidus sp. D384]